MGSLLAKMNYKDYERVGIINAPPDLFRLLTTELKGVMVDTNVDPRYLYEFIVLFVHSKKELIELAPVVMHNIVTDGKLWISYPKKSSKDHASDIDRDHGWEPLLDNGYQGVRMVSIDQNWSSLRFRNSKFVRSSREK